MVLASQGSLAALTELLCNSLRPLAQAWYGLLAFCTRFCASSKGLKLKGSIHNFARCENLISIGIAAPTKIHFQIHW
jgi:hypothetical protein